MIYKFPDVTPANTIKFARECIGTPFKHQGRIRKKGMDCPGPLIHVMKRYGLAFNDGRGYPRVPYQGMLEAIMDNQPHVKKINKFDYEVGDFLLMRFRKDPQHLAILSFDEKIIHSYSGIGKVVEHQCDGFWIKRVVSVYRIVP